MTFKIAIIGAGSIGFTKKLVSDILKWLNLLTSKSR